ncbi:S25 ribosomal protein-domain-containing protein [Delphinella strobiligena]|nr:S25 ribosomal protein-domain-containing protein [Delphinella strobiligena]
MAPAATGGKKQKKKWSKGKVKDKAQHAVVLDKQTNDRLQKDVQSYRLVTVATLVDRLKINGSLARRALADLEEKGQIRKIVHHHTGHIYSAFIFGLQAIPNNPLTRTFTARAVAASD